LPRITVSGTYIPEPVKPLEFLQRRSLPAVEHIQDDGLIAAVLALTHPNARIDRQITREQDGSLDAAVNVPKATSDLLFLSGAKGTRSPDPHTVKDTDIHSVQERIDATLPFVIENLATREFDATYEI
jgi:hypothetical protein